jgi:hypothetical protein
MAIDHKIGQLMATFANLQKPIAADQKRAKGALPSKEPRHFLGAPSLPAEIKPMVMLFYRCGADSR